MEWAQYTTQREQDGAQNAEVKGARERKNKTAGK